ncbi:MAG: type II secretion system F family protein [Clostridiales bacterium]|nr:type II secretion system F family protein [Clostridiales bacterium]
MNLDLADLLDISPSHRDLSLVCRSLSFILKAGVKPHQAIPILSARIKNKRLQTILANIHKHLLKGDSLYAAINSSPFPKLIAGLCHVGELTGRLPDVFSNLADYYEKSDKSRGAMTGALIYPAIVAIAAFAVMIMSVIVVLPGYSSIFAAEGIILPLPTRILMSFGDFITDYGHLVIIALAILLLGLFSFSKTKKGLYFFGYLKAHLPIIRRLYLKIFNLRFCQGMAMTTSAGLTIVVSMGIMRGMLGNEYLNEYMEQIIKKLAEGDELSDALREVKFFDPLILSMTKIGENTNSLDETFEQCSSYFQADLERDTLVIGRLVEPAVTLLLGIVTAFIMLSIILPTFQLVNVY